MFINGGKAPISVPRGCDAQEKSEQITKKTAVTLLEGVIKLNELDCVI